MSLHSSIAGAKPKNLQYFKRKEYDELRKNLKNKFENIKTTAFDSRRSTDLATEKVKEVFGLASKTTKYATTKAEYVEMRQETYEKLFNELDKHYATLWEMIAEDFKYDSRLFILANQGAMIERGKLILKNEKRKRQKQDHELDKINQRASKVTRKLQDVQDERVQTEHNIESLKTELRIMQWVNVEGVDAETGEWETEIDEGKMGIDEGKIGIDEGKMGINEGKMEINDGQTDVNEGKTDVSEDETVY
ncbi:hypothetical protein GJ744_006280 [Endocarpon pusillum]|uniref:Uncharacterized protein n=1 Tax=Endocarpon pusillum TaxID=364733 RepID=A0A8H7DWT5_9EURO|nr:hypothetical protein GJ744_006280 [Endocarpon pusillum]